MERLRRIIKDLPKANSQIIRYSLLVINFKIGDFNNE